MELTEPVLTDAGREANFTHELGVDGRYRFLHAGPELRALIARTHPRALRPHAEPQGLR